jgi:uncharacterized protein (TIGR02265 family)
VSPLSPSLSPRADDVGFDVPTWMDDVSLAEHLAICAHGASTRGTFFEHVRDLVAKELGEVPSSLFEGTSARKWISFHTYPLREFMCLAHNAARIVYPRVPRSEGLRRVGWKSYPSFASTMAGRVVLFAFGDQLDDVLRSASTAYRVALPGASVTATEIARQHWRFELRDVYSFVHSYHYGVLEGAIMAFERRPAIGLRRLARLSDADFDVRWT